MTKHANLEELKNEIESHREIYPRFSDDNLFVLWFFRAFVTGEINEAKNAVTGEKNDKNIDGLFIDEKARLVFIVQAKYREEIGKKNESRNDVIGFAELPEKIICEKKSDFEKFIYSCPANLQEKLRQARERILNRSYRLKLFYVTLGKCSKDLEDEAIRIARATANSALEIMDGKRVLRLLTDYLEGVAPPIASAELEMESGHGVAVTSIFNRYDKKTKIDAWVFSMKGDAIANLLENAGLRIFARNVRGFLGETKVNRAMEETLTEEAEFFWYYNNGITIICDEAHHKSSKGRDILYVENPQIINGQQTTRTLSKLSSLASDASVLIRVIRVAREGDDKHKDFESLVSSIVAATNWQNAIKASDLMANDRKQIELEREMRKLGYLYLRKRQSKHEAKRGLAANTYTIINKEEVAQAVAACDLDPTVVRRGKEKLFEEENYNYVFPNSDPYYYLCRFWLSRITKYCAMGYPERAYAKWLAINFIWSYLKKVLTTRNLREKYVYQARIQHDKYLIKAINTVFNAALTYYRKERGKGPTAIDVSTFFKRGNLHKGFKKFWESDENRFSNSFKKHFARFEKELKKSL